MVWVLVSNFLPLISSHLCAQEQECATVLTPEQVRHEREKFPPGWVYPHISAVAPSECLALTIHIVQHSNGTGGLTQTDLVKAVRDLNAQFQQVPMRFIQKGCVDYINSDAFYSGRDWALLFDVNSAPHTINVYFVPNIPFCGVSTFTTTPVQGIIVNTACAGNVATLSHEMGHFFDLYHTHETDFGVECPDGSNCSDAGDRLCDTPADPNLRGHVDTNCVYDNYADTPPGCGGIYAPQTDNVMSYSNSWCRELFTVEQKNKMLFTLLNSPNRINLLKLPCGLFSTCPGDTTVEICPGETGSPVSYSVATFDSCPSTLVVCTPPAGFEFPLGSTSVTCVAKNVSDFEDSCQFTVSVVKDSIPPVASCPADTVLLVPEVACSTVVVNYSAGDVGNCAGSGVVCNPPSGSAFPAGITAVTCVTSDPTGNATCSFAVTVPVRLKGDMDASSDVTLADAVLMLNCVFLNSGNCDPCFADVNCSGDLSPADVVLELNAVFLGRGFPCLTIPDTKVSTTSGDVRK